VCCCVRDPKFSRFDTIPAYDGRTHRQSDRRRRRDGIYRATLSVFEGHFPIASLFKCDILYLWRVKRSLCICRASCSYSRAAVNKISTITRNIARFLCVSSASLLRPREGCEFLWWVCLFLCLFVSVCLSIRSHNWKATWPNFQDLFACYLGPRLGPPVTAWRYVLYFRFYGWRIDVTFSCHEPMGQIKDDVMFKKRLPGGGTAVGCHCQKTRSTVFNWVIRMQHRGRSPLSTTVLFYEMQTVGDCNIQLCNEMFA